MDIIQKYKDGQQSTYRLAIDANCSVSEIESILKEAHLKYKKRNEKDRNDYLKHCVDNLDWWVSQIGDETYPNTQLPNYKRIDWELRQLGYSTALSEERKFKKQIIERKKQKQKKKIEDNEKIFKLREEGNSYREIARLIGVSHMTIKRRLDEK